MTHIKNMDDCVDIWRVIFVFARYSMRTMSFSQVLIGSRPIVGLMVGLILWKYWAIFFIKRFH